MVIATVLTYAALFYYELVFAAFVTFTVAFYTIWTYRRAPGSIVLAGIAQGGGAALGLATVILQLILYLGWQDFLTDLRLTLTARNYAPDDIEFVTTLRNFYQARNIAFFYNIQSSDQFAGLVTSLRFFSRYVLQTSTPFLSLLGIGMAVASLLANSRRSGPHDLVTIVPSVSISAAAQLVPGLFLFTLAIVSGDAVVGLPFAGTNGTIGTVVLAAFSCLLVSVALAYVLPICARAISISGTLPGVYRALRTNLFLLGLGLLILAQGEVYDQGAAALWWRQLMPVPVWLAKVVVAPRLSSAPCSFSRAARGAGSLAPRAVFTRSIPPLWRPGVSDRLQAERGICVQRLPLFVFAHSLCFMSTRCLHSVCLSRSQSLRRFSAARTSTIPPPGAPARRR